MATGAATAVLAFCISFNAVSDAVLSLSFDPEKLARRQAALRNVGLDVVSVYSPSQARFEIEMGRCGVFVTTYEISDIINRDLIDLFRRNCADGFVIFIEGTTAFRKSPYQLDADVSLSESEDPQGVVNALQAFRAAPPSQSFDQP